MKQFTLIFLISISFLANAQNKTVVKIQGNQLDKNYSVLFSSPVEQNVEIKLFDESNKMLISHKMYGKGFMKHFDLSRLAPGEYNWEVTYGQEKHSEKLALFSEKDLMKNSIEVDFTEFIVDIHVKKYNNLPMNIFMYNENGDQLEYEFWEPDKNSRNKKIDISQFTAREIKLEIEQNGSLAYSGSYAIY